MRRRSSGENRNKSLRMWRSFFLLVGGLVGGYLIVAGVVVFAFIKPQVPQVKAEGIDYTKDAEPVKKLEPDKEKTFKNTYLIPPKITTALVLGTDQGSLLTDVVMLVFFNRDSGEIDIVNVPRDLYVTLPQELENEIKGAGKYIPKSMKITELHSYAGSDLGDYAVKKFLDSEFNLSIDYTVNISLESFRRIVDIVGPITMEIPAGGLHYFDPDQNLTINVPGGTQQLNGQLAEGVVRYRATYQRGDLQRIEVQQEFMKLLFKQVLDKDTLISNAPAILATIIEFVDTDFKVMEAPKYLPYISKLKADKLETRTLPGESQYLSNGEQNISYYVHDPVACSELFDGIIFSSDEGVTLEVQMFNGGADEERFNKIVEKLEGDGFIVFVSEGYSGEKIKETRIALKEGQAESALNKYFSNASIDTELEVPDEFEAVIIVGSQE